MVVFVTGADSLRRTLLCDAYASRRSVLHSTVRGLVRQVHTCVTWHRDQRTGQLEHDRQALVLALSSIVACGKSLVLEGALSQRTECAGIHADDTEFIERLPLKAIVLVEAASQTATDDDRCSPQLERQHALELSQSLDIALHIVPATDCEVFIEVLDQCFAATR